LGGSISGLTGSGLVLTNNNNALLSVNAGAGTVTFAFTNVPSGTAYALTVATQPLGLNCTLSNNTGTITANVTNIQVTCVAAPSFAWTWMNGSNSFTTVSGNYGTQGVENSTNVPSGRYGAASWIDANGNFWMFGGHDSQSNNFNDLWKFNSVTSRWTWISGSNSANASGNYGTKGAAASDTTPGARYGAVTWRDSNGNFWLFGGFGPFNDLWKFNPSTNQWTWINGSNVGSARGDYGTKGVSASSNVPGARMNAISWIDSTNNLWLFGGTGIDSNNQNKVLNDLWKFNPSTEQWIWMSGSNIGNQSGVYGTQGAAASGNVPGAHEDSMSWMDNAGNLWLFGGGGYPESGPYSLLDDLWKFTPSLEQWTWVGGHKVNGGGAVAPDYGTRGLAAASNTPGSRYNAVTWTDNQGILWLLGGYAYSSSSNNARISDLWKYDTSTGLWTWVNGPSVNRINAQGTYGTKGITDINNIPGARAWATASWDNTSSTLWLFGGDAADSGGFAAPLNDLWKLH
jgi:N-acetylneuraminic acid mutarotase